MSLEQLKIPDSVGNFCLLSKLILLMFGNRYNYDRLVWYLAGHLRGYRNGTCTTTYIQE